MTERDEVHVGDINTSLELIVTEGGAVVDIGTASSMTIRFRKPSGTIVEKTAVLKTDGSDGNMRYLSESGFLDEAGRWMRQGHFTLGTWTGSTDAVIFHVYPALTPSA